MSIVPRQKRDKTLDQYLAATCLRQDDIHVCGRLKNHGGKHQCAAVGCEGPHEWSDT
jgi:hypothetical protein